MGMNVYIDSKDFHFDYNKTITGAFSCFFTNDNYHRITPNYNVNYYLDKKEFIKLIDYVKEDPYKLFSHKTLMFSRDYRENVLYDLNRMLMLLRKKEKVRVRFA